MEDFEDSGLYRTSLKKFIYLKGYIQYELNFDFSKKSFKLTDGNGAEVAINSTPVIDSLTVSESDSITGEYHPRIIRNKNVMMYGAVVVVIVIIGIGGIFLLSRCVSSPENKEEKNKKSSLPKKISKGSKSGKYGKRKMNSTKP